MKQGSDEDDEKRPVNVRKGKKKVSGPEQPGGSWQQFMAWVPNGAALMNPEPWKPLPPQASATLVAPSSGGGTLKKQASLMSPSASGGMQGILPGGVPGEMAREKSGDGDDSDD